MTRHNWPISCNSGCGSCTSTFVVTMVILIAAGGLAIAHRQGRRGQRQEYTERLIPAGQPSAAMRSPALPPRGWAPPGWMPPPGWVPPPGWAPAPFPPGYSQRSGGQGQLAPTPKGFQAVGTPRAAAPPTPNWAPPPGWALPIDALQLSDDPQALPGGPVSWPPGPASAGGGQAPSLGARPPPSYALPPKSRQGRAGQ